MSTEHIFSFVFGGLIALVWILCLRYTPLSLRLSDVPNMRSSHDIVVPRGAGFAFALTVFVSSCIFSQSIFLNSVGLLVALLGLYDDMQGLSARKRFLIQIILCSLIVLSIEVPLWVKAPLLLLMVSSINFYNFADGINGHVALQTLICLGSWILLGVNIQSDPMVVGLVGSVLVFAWYNLHKKCAFMGDAGSTFLGFYLIALPWMQGIEGGHFQYFTSALVFSFVIFMDCALLIGIKILSGIPFSMPHRHHFYQLLSRQKGWNHPRTSIFLAFWQMAISLAYISAIHFDKRWYWMLSALMLIYVYCASFHIGKARQDLLMLRSVQI
jgi:UDP-GlcNAc:undecaprenyl-phosphate GlcNAc-1-phosphate transferase